MNIIAFTSLFYMIGILVGYYLNPSPFPVPLLILTLTLSSTFFILSGFILSRHPGYRFDRALFLTLLSFLFLGLGTLRLQQTVIPIDEVSSCHLTNYIKDFNSNTTPLTLIGRIIEPPEYFSQKIRLILDVEKIILPKQNIMTSGKVQLFWYHPSSEKYQFYDLVQVTARISLPHDYKNPGGFSYTHYLHQKGICAIGRILNLKDPKKHYPTLRARTIPWSKQILRMTYKFREKISKQIEDILPADDNGPSTASSLLQGVLLGEKHKIPKQIQESFVKAGGAHLLSISGLHLSIIAAAIFSCIKFMLYCLPDRWFEMLTLWVKPSHLAALGSIPIIIFYTLLTGSRVSTIRGCIMINIYLLSLLLERGKKLWSALVLAAFLILLRQPAALFQADFQLTFLATGAILSIIKYLPPKSSHENSHFFPGLLLILKNYLLGSFYLSLLVFLLVSPLAAYYFNLVSPIGIITNLFAIPILICLIYPGLGGFAILSIWPALSCLILNLNAWPGKLLIKIMDLASQIPMAFFYTPSPPKVYILITYLTMLILFLLLKAYLSKPLYLWNILYIVGIPVCFLFFITHYCIPAHYSQNLMVTFLEVGKGDACLIRTPNGKHILIDGGGSYNHDFDLGEKVLAPYLWHEKIKKIDLVILTHPHPDHFLGLIFILKHFPVAQIWKTEDRSYSPDYNILENVIKERNIPVRYLTKGDQFLIDSLFVEILGPDKLSADYKTLKKTFRMENNNSLVLKISLQQVSFLFTGDIEKEAEGDLLLKFGPHLRSTILKVPHHGSRYSSSSSFIQVVSPKVAVFSARNEATYSFPHPQTLTRYQKIPCLIYRTDLDGAITITTNGQDFTIATENEAVKNKKNTDK